MVGKWLGIFVGKWLGGESYTSPPEPPSVISDWLIRARRRLRR
jgi:hypothetical protein